MPDGATTSLCISSQWSFCKWADIHTCQCCTPRFSGAGVSSSLPLSVTLCYRRVANLWAVRTTYRHVRAKLNVYMQFSIVQRGWAMLWCLGLCVSCWCPRVSYPFGIVAFSFSLSRECWYDELVGVVNLQCIYGISVLGLNGVAVNCQPVLKVDLTSSRRIAIIEH